MECLPPLGSPTSPRTANGDGIGLHVRHGPSGYGDHLSERQTSCTKRLRNGATEADLETRCCGLSPCGRAIWLEPTVVRCESLLYNAGN